MVNTRALEEIIPVLRELEAIEKFNMSNWIDGVLNPNADTVTTCGTQFCMAGAKAYIDGWLPQWELSPRRVPIPNDPEGRTEVIEVRVSTGEFLPADRPDLLGQPDADEERDAESISTEAFELDYDYEHTVFLFHGTHITRVADLERRIRWVIDNPKRHVCNFPSEWITEEREHHCQDERRNDPNFSHRCNYCPPGYGAGEDY